ncbi:MAG: septum site-determining protein MinC, partial [Chloroflexi bacterium]
MWRARGIRQRAPAGPAAPPSTSPAAPPRFRRRSPAPMPA